ncbi:MAG: PPA1309 family protein [Nocardioides sp.]
MTDQATLEAAVAEIEAHVAAGGWDQSARLYALVPTASLLRHEPQLAKQLGLDPAATTSLTPIEQETHDGHQSLEELLASVVWPGEVVGCAVVVERVVLPPEAEAQLPEDPDQAAAYAASHPGRHEVRMVAGVTRDGAAYCALRVRADDSPASPSNQSPDDQSPDDQSPDDQGPGDQGPGEHPMITGPDLVPELIDLLRITLDEEPSL